MKSILRTVLLTLAFLFCAMASTSAAPPRFEKVLPGSALSFPADFGAHPGYRTEWWYATGWLETPDKKSLGFQITFFRSATDHDAANPSAFAPKQLIIAHAALSDPAVGKLQHDQRTARQGFDLAFVREGNTDVRISDWTMVRDASGKYQASVTTTDFNLRISMTPTQPLLLQGDAGFSRKGPQVAQASHYYSEPHLKVEGSLTRKGQPVAVKGTAWLDHEWSTSVLDAEATGWDWIGANLDDGSALMAFQIRSKSGDKLWAHATMRDASGTLTQFDQNQIRFTPERIWASPRTKANYPVATRIQTGQIEWRLTPLQDDQELDSRQSTGSVYWEGAVTLTRDGKPAGRGYLEMTGYVKPLKL